MKLKKVFALGFEALYLLKYSFAYQQKENFLSIILIQKLQYTL